MCLDTYLGISIGGLEANDAPGIESLPEECSSQCMRRREIDAALFATMSPSLLDYVGMYLFDGQ